MTATEREQAVPLGIKLAQATQKAVNEWESQRRATVEKKVIGSGHPRPSREKTWLRQANPEGRGKFIGEKLNLILGDPGFSEILGNHINGYLPREKSFKHQELDEVKDSLEKLNKNQLDLIKRFYRLRLGLTGDNRQADLARKELDTFNRENLDQISDDEEFLIGIFRTISNLYPDPKTMKK
jgi:hypothetical protein